MNDYLQLCTLLLLLLLQQHRRPLIWQSYVPLLTPCDTEMNLAVHNRNAYLLAACQVVQPKSFYIPSPRQRAKPLA